MKFIRYEDQIYNLDQLNYIYIGSYELILRFKTNQTDPEGIFYLSSALEENQLGFKLRKIIEFIENDQKFLLLEDCLNRE